MNVVISGPEVHKFKFENPELDTPYHYLLETIKEKLPDAQVLITIRNDILWVQVGPPVPSAEDTVSILPLFDSWYNTYGNAILNKLLLAIEFDDNETKENTEIGEESIEAQRRACFTPPSREDTV